LAHPVGEALDFATLRACTDDTLQGGFVRPEFLTQSDHTHQ